MILISFHCGERVAFGYWCPRFVAVCSVAWPVLCSGAVHAHLWRQRVLLVGPACTMESSHIDVSDTVGSTLAVHFFLMCLTSFLCSYPFLLLSVSCTDMF